MFKLIKLIPIAWMAYKWIREKKMSEDYKASRFSNRGGRR